MSALPNFIDGELEETKVCFPPMIDIKKHALMSSSGTKLNLMTYIDRTSCNEIKAAQLLPIRFQNDESPER